MDNYSLNPYKFSLSEYQAILKTKDILPGRIILKDNIDQNFTILKENGIHSIGDLLDALKTKKKIESFALKTGLSLEYLTILRRDVNAYYSRPVNLKEFPDVPKSFVNILATHGILHTRHYFELSISKQDRKNLVQITGASMDDVLTLARLSNLVRINGVGPVFATMLLDAGIDRIEQIVQEDAQVLYKKLVKQNALKKYTQAKFILNDIYYIKEFARKLPLVTIY